MTDDAKNQISRVCQEHNLALTSMDVDQDVIVLVLDRVPEVSKAQAVAAKLKSQGHRWIAFEVAS